MAETHNIAGPPHGEPLAAGHVGARVRIPLSGTPSPRWSRVLSARLATALVGHPAIGHLRLSSLVQGSDIVLEGVEPAEAGQLGPALLSAIGAANSDGQSSQQAAETAARNMSQDEADDIAGLIHLDYEPRMGVKPPARSFPGR